MNDRLPVQFVAVPVLRSSQQVTFDSPNRLCTVATMEKIHYLSPFLEKRLPELGLDYETYGPYVMGGMEDEDEMEGVLELLQASSETHGDDLEAWKALKEEILKLQREQLQKEHEAFEEEQQRQHEKEKERLKHDIELALHQPPPQAKKKEVDSQTQALVDRFAYEQDGEETEEEVQVVTNKAAAAQMHVEKVKELSHGHTQSKREAQQETKKAKAEKIQMKEERRKRAQKGERKR
jgi:hypothetical protein